MSAPESKVMFEIWGKIHLFHFASKVWQSHMVGSALIRTAGVSVCQTFGMIKLQDSDATESAKPWNLIKVSDLLWLYNNCKQTYADEEPSLVRNISLG